MSCNLPCGIYMGKFYITDILKQISINDLYKHTKTVMPNTADIYNCKYSEVIRNFYKDTKIFREYTIIIRSIQIQVTESFEDKYITSLCQHSVQFEKRTPNEIISYIVKTYADMTQEAIHKNVESMNKDWNPIKTIKNIFDCIRKRNRCFQHYTAIAYRPAQVTNTAYIIISRKPDFTTKHVKIGFIKEGET